MHKLIEEKVKKIKNEIEIVEALEGDILALENIFYSLGRKGKVYIGYDNKISIDVIVRTMKEVPSVLKIFSKGGYHQVSKSRDIPSCLSKAWELNHNVILYTDFKETSEGPSCKYVQIGVKEEPVYELQCNES